MTEVYSNALYMPTIRCRDVLFRFFSFILILCHVEMYQALALMLLEFIMHLEQIIS